MVQGVGCRALPIIKRETKNKERKNKDCNIFEGPTWTPYTGGQDHEMERQNMNHHLFTNCPFEASNETTNNSH